MTCDKQSHNGRAADGPDPVRLALYCGEQLFPGSMKPAAQSAPASATGAPTVAQAAPVALKPREAALKDSPRVMIETPKMRGSIALEGRVDR